MTVKNETTAEKPITLTDREIAIASGQDPDEVEKPEEKAEEVVEAVDEKETAPGTDAENGEGTEALETSPEKADEAPAVAGKIEAAWITAEVEREAESYSLSKDDLLDLGDEDSYKRIKKVLDKQYHEAGQKALQAPPQKPAEKAEEAKPVAKAGKDGKYDIEKLKAEGYDENILSLFAHVNEQADTIKAQNEANERFAYQAHVNEFHAATDGIDNDLFGKSFQDGKPTKLAKSHDDNRRKLYEAAETIVAGIFTKAQAAGIEPKVPPMPVLLLRARDLAFGDVIRERAAKQRVQKIAAQSTQRRPAGRPTRTKPTTAVEKDPVKLIANNPDIVRFFQEAQEANGVAA